VSKSKLISVVIALLTMAACAPGARPDPNPQPDHGPPDGFELTTPTGPADYRALLSVVNDPAGAFYFEDRWVDCSIIGKGRDKRVVTVKDSKTGVVMPYQNFIPDIRIPYNKIYDLPIQNIEGAAAFIEVVCTGLLYAGDALMMEITLDDRNRLAPVISSVEMDEIPRDVDPSRLYAAIVTATIATGA
jgi:hypothetical protein